jgi:hypothetical protein
MMVVRYTPILRSDPPPDPMRCEAGVNGDYLSPWRQCRNAAKYHAFDANGLPIKVCGTHSRKKPSPLARRTGRGAGGEG